MRTSGSSITVATSVLSTTGATEPAASGSVAPATTVTDAWPDTAPRRSRNPRSMRSLSIGLPSRAMRSPTASARPASAGANTSPGFVQNWPTPIVKDPTSPSATSSSREDAAPGVTTTGLMLPSSP